MRGPATREPVCLPALDAAAKEQGNAHEGVNVTHALAGRSGQCLLLEVEGRVDQDEERVEVDGARALRHDHHPLSARDVGDVGDPGDRRTVQDRVGLDRSTAEDSPIA